MKLFYTPQARGDLAELKSYIALVLYNAQAAGEITNNLINTISCLKQQTYMGIALAAKLRIVTDIRYLVIGKYIVFYKTVAQHIIIIRIFAGKVNYLPILLKEAERINK